jgi:hypothetical protein
MRQVIINRLLRKSEVIKAEAKRNGDTATIQNMEEFIALLQILERTKDD